MRRWQGGEEVAGTRLLPMMHQKQPRSSPRTPNLQRTRCTVCYMSYRHPRRLGCTIMEPTTSCLLQHQREWKVVLHAGSRKDTHSRR